MQRERDPLAMEFGKNLCPESTPNKYALYKIASDLKLLLFDPVLALSDLATGRLVACESPFVVWYAKLCYR